MNAVLSAAALGVLALAFAGCASLPPPESYTAVRAVSPVVVDGRADEADWSRAEWATNFVDITGDPAKAPVYPTRVKMLWDEQALYVYAELTEPKVTATLTNRDDVVWHDNDFEIFIDTDDDGENYFEFEFNAANTLFDLFLTRPYSDPRGNFVMHQWNADGIRSAVRVDGTLNDNRDTDRGWTLEAAIPNVALANGFELPLAFGRMLRVGFSRVEWLKKEREENWTWGATGRIDMHMPWRWGKVLLGW